MRRGLVLIGLAAISWGTTGSVTTILVTDAAASPLIIGLVRLWLAAIVLVAAAVLLTPPLAIDRADRWRVLVAGAAMAVYQGSYFSAVVLAGITVAALISICSAPLVISTLAALFLGEQLTRRVLVALGLGIAGTGLMIAGPGGDTAAPSGFIAGAALALLAGIAYAVYAVVTKAGLARSRPLPIAAMNFAIAAVLLTPALSWTDAPARQIVLGWPWLLYLGVVATGAAYAAYSIGLRTVPASVAGVVALVEPLTATLLGVLVFGERLGAAGVAGAVLLLAALGLLTTPTRGSAGSPRG
jgi:DME family drug/metabolite transporter